MYTLKIYDEPLIKFNMENRPTLKIFEITVLSSQINLSSEALKKEVNKETIKKF